MTILFNTPLGMAIAMIAEIGAIGTGAAATINQDIGPGEYAIVITATLSVAIISLGFFIGNFIIRTGKNTADLYEKVNTNTNGHAVLDNKVDIQFGHIKDEIQGVKIEMGRVRQGLQANKALKDEIMNKLNSIKA